MDRSLVELSPPTRWIGVETHIYAEIDSTNLRAEALAAGGAREGTLVIADGQTAGRGRLGRSFWSPPGRSLYFSMILRPEILADRAHEYVFAASAAVADAVSAALPTASVEIKWPNDVLLEGRKTCGINLPARLDGDRVTSLVLGVGVNVNLAAAELPEELRAIATSLRIAGGAPLDRVAFAEDLLARLERVIDRLRSEGFAAVLDAWQKYFRMRGARVRIGGPGVSRELEGTVEGVDAEGALLIGTDQGRERVLAGDVTLLSRKG